MNIWKLSPRYAHNYLEVKIMYSDKKKETLEALADRGYKSVNHLLLVALCRGLEQIEREESGEI